MCRLPRVTYLDEPNPVPKHHRRRRRQTPAKPQHAVTSARHTVDIVVIRNRCRVVMCRVPQGEPALRHKRLGLLYRG